MTYAVMQPYLFPYLGYFQLVAAADCFVFYDDVQYVRKSYVNRNKLAFGKFTLPLKGAPQSTLIKDRYVSQSEFGRGRRSWRRSFEQSYGKAPFYEPTLALTRSTWDLAEHGADLATVAAAGVRSIAGYLGLTTAFRCASNLTYDRQLKGQERMLDLLAGTPATRYVNAPGGRALYAAEAFQARGLELRFIESPLLAPPVAEPYTYSMLHLLAHHPVEHCRDLVLNHYELQP